MGKINAFYAMPHPPIVIPEVGKGEEKKIKKTSDACHKIANDIADKNPDTIIIVTPHGPVFSDAIAISNGDIIYGNLGKFDAREIEVDLDIDIALTEKIIEYSEIEKLSIVQINKRTCEQYGIDYELDHGSIVPLHFICDRLSGFKIIHITYGLLSKIQLYRFGMCIKKAVDESGANAVFIASGDLSHRLSKDDSYKYSAYGVKFDKEILSLLMKGDVIGVFNMDNTMIENAGECGLNCYYIMLGAMNGNSIKGNLLSYEDVFGVGYGVLDFVLTEGKEDIYNNLLEQKKKAFIKKIENEGLYVRLARESLTYYLMNKKYMDIPDYVTIEMKKLKRGVFVSIKKEGRLRGCIGTIFPSTDNVASEIIRNAVSAGNHDSRFSAVTKDELIELDFSVDILTESQKVKLEDMNPQKYGIIVRSGKKTGLLLPNLEGVDTVEQQLNIALQKGNISEDEDYIIERFEVIRYK